VSIEGVIGDAAATTGVTGVIRITHGPRDPRRRIVKEAGCAIVATTGAMAGVTAGEMAMTNGAAVMVAEPVLFRFQIQVRRKAEVESRIMVAPMGNPAGEIAGRQMGIPSPRLRGKFRRYDRMLGLLNNRLNPAPSHKVQKRHGSACLKAV